MTLLLLLAAIAVLGIVVAVGIGRIGGGLGEPTTSLPDDAIGESGPLDLNAVRLSPALRGYRMDQVDALIDRLSSELREQEDEIARLRSQLAERE